MQKRPRKFADFLQIRCANLCSKLVFHAEAGIVCDWFLNLSKKLHPIFTIMLS